jgi:urease accessory protein
MSVAVSASDEGQRTAGSDALARIRVVGGLGARFVATPPTTGLAHLFESGGYRLKFPQIHAGAVEAVIVNTGGGVAGGDRVSIEMAADAAASATISTATAERIYRSAGDAAQIDVRLAAAVGATLGWLPQATILFAGARLARQITADVATDARLVVAETTVFGRIASGEVVHEGAVREQWRIRRDGRLVFAEATHLDGAIAATLARPAVAGGMRVVSLLVGVAPDIEERCEAVRAALDEPAGMTSRGGQVGADATRASDIEAGVSAWNGVLVARIIGARLDAVEFALSRALGALKLCAPPRTWPAPLQ